jgi:hypothetical protein
MLGEPVYDLTVNDHNIVDEAILVELKPMT